MLDQPPFVLQEVLSIVSRVPTPKVDTRLLRQGFRDSGGSNGDVGFKSARQEQAVTPSPLETVKVQVGTDAGFAAGVPERKPVGRPQTDLVAELHILAPLPACGPPHVPGAASRVC